jgi:RES domain-containing protein
LSRLTGPWSRAIGYRLLLGPPPGQTGPPQPLWGGAAKIAGARFTPTGGFDSIYVAHDPITAFIEVTALVLLPGGPVPVRSAPWVVISVEGILNGLLDLTDPTTLAALGATAQEMTGAWAATPNPPTQLLGQLAFDSGRIAGIKYASAKHPGGINVMVFSDRVSIVAGNYLEVYDPHGHLAQHLS